MKFLRRFFPSCLLFLMFPSLVGAGVPVTYQLPVEGPLPRTYCVTLAVTDAKNPDWIVSTFLAGQPRTVTAENQGRFTETWDGLDENFMPVPPGNYGVKGIYMAAKQWAVDGEWHGITPRFIGGAGTWLPAGEKAGGGAGKPVAELFGGDPVNAPLGDIAVGPDGISAWAWTYLENGTNYPLLDLKKPAGPGQFIRAFNSGGAGGSNAIATDGVTVWAFSVDGGPKYVFRTDEKSFGRSDGANRTNGYLPEGWVTGMALGEDAGRKLLCVAQRGRFVEKGRNNYVESDTEFVDKITIHDAENGAVLNTLTLPRPRALVVRGGLLHALHAAGGGFAISSTPLAGLAAGGGSRAWQTVFVVPPAISPADMEMDSRGRVYLSDTRAHKVFQLDAPGRVLREFGKTWPENPGPYDRERLIAPGRLATWTDAEGTDRLLIIENGGPNRVTEWTADGKLEREFMTLQTHANEGYAVDPENPSDIYLPGQQDWLTCFHVDYTTGQWTVKAVWPHVGDDPQSPGLSKPRLIRAQGRLYLAGGRSLNVYRFDGTRWMLSAGILTGKQPEGVAFWNDANGNGKVDAEEKRPVKLPGNFLTYHGQNWLDDLSLIAPSQNEKDVWRLAPSGWDAHGNPVFTEFTRVLTDPVFAARAAGTADAIHGGNELAGAYVSDWMQADGSMAEGFYVQARGGKSFSANEGPQHKISRYLPDGKGGYTLKWRVGRTAMLRLAGRGEIYGAMRIQRPVNGLLSVVDQSRCGILLYTEDGLYVDTLFADERRATREKTGLYAHPGEFFAGSVFPNKDDGGIYIAMGKHTPLLFAVEGWSLTENPVRRLTGLPLSVSISASQTSAPPEIALTVRGGAGKAKFMHFAPALGEVDLSGESTRGWESAEPVTFQADEKQTVEARCLYRPDTLLLRWHARLSAPFAARPLPALERIFTHDQLADTLSFYLQGNPVALPGGPPEGREGDVRFVFGLFAEGGAVKPVALGLYPKWHGPGKPKPQVYRTAQTAAFDHAGPVSGMKLGHALDSDGRGFVLTAAIPRAAIPMMEKPFTGGLQTMVDFSATFAGHNKFWWANSDGSGSRETFDEPTEARLYPGAWAPGRFQGLESGVVARHWMICGPFGGPGAERFKEDVNGTLPGTNLNAKEAAHAFCEAGVYPPDDGQVDPLAVFKGDSIKGYWRERGDVRWTPASVRELDERISLGEAAQTWYGATWVHVPADTALECRFESHPMTTLHWFVNNQAVPGLILKEQKKDDNRPRAIQTVNLKAGWNQVRFRGHCVGYPPFRAGLVILGPEEKLWSLGLSGHPPEK